MPIKVFRSDCVLFNNFSYDVVIILIKIEFFNFGN